MQKIIFLLFLTSIIQQSWTQTYFVTPKVILEPWDATSDRVIDVELKNPSPKKAYILRMEKHPEWQHVLSSSTIEPNGTLIVRLKMNPAQKGKFQHTLLFTMSDHNEPIPLIIKGNNFELGQRLAQECPDFNVLPSKFTPQNIEINVIDKYSGAPLPNVTVTLQKNGLVATSITTNREGYDTKKMTIGYYYFSVNHPGYQTFEGGAYLSFQNSSITLALTPKNDDVVIIEPEYTNNDDPISTPITQIDIPEESIEKPQVEPQKKIEEQIIPPQKSNISTAIPPLSELPDSSFNLNYFKPINVTFVLDVSSSMKQYDRMELMKSALQHLTQQIRPEDFMSIVTYADEAEVVLEPTRGDAKSKIENSISNLVAGGYTAGGLGIKQGYKEVLKNLDSNHANMVFIITDGAFNKSSDNYQKLVQKYAVQHISFHVVGIKINKTDAAKMQEAAQFGKGTFTKIYKLSDAQNNLFQSIRQSCYLGVN